MALTVFKTVRDLTTSGWVGSIPMHSRHAGRGIAIEFFNPSSFVMISLRRAAFVALLAPCAAPNAFAQRPDSTRVPAADTTAADSITPPLTPKRAFFYSFLAPGSAQSILGRHKAAAGFLLVEAVSLIMVRESAADVHEARRIANDTIVVSYVDESGAAVTPIFTAPPQFTTNYVHARQAHLEDWIALLVANHLLAGADAFVAANLWDVRAHLGLRVAPGSAALMASVRWR